MKSNITLVLVKEEEYQNRGLGQAAFYVTSDMMSGTQETGQPAGCDETFYFEKIMNEQKCNI